LGFSQIFLGAIFDAATDLSHNRSLRFCQGGELTWKGSFPAIQFSPTTFVRVEVIDIPAHVNSAPHNDGSVQHMPSEFHSRLFVFSLESPYSTRVLVCKCPANSSQTCLASNSSFFSTRVFRAFNTRVERSMKSTAERLPDLIGKDLHTGTQVELRDFEEKKWSFLGLLRRKHTG
jgi:hypothetical protein